MLTANLSEAITRTESVTSFEILSVLEDYESQRVVATVRAGQTQVPVILWSGAEYDPARNWKNADVIARVKEVLPGALA